MVQSGFRLIHAAPKFKSIAIGLVATIQNLLDIGLPTRIRQTLQVDGAATLNSLTLGTPLAISNIGDGTITNAKLASGIDAGKATTGTLPAARVAARSVTFDKLLIGTAPNLVPDPRMLSTTIWSATYRQDGGGYDGGNSLLVPANTAATVWGGSIANSGQPIAAGTRLLCEYWVTSTVDRAASTARLYGRWYDDTDAYTNWTVNNPALTANTPVRVSAELLVPTTRGTMPRVVFGFNTTAADGDITFSAPVVQVIPTASLTDATGASTLPSVTANTSIRTLMQTVRNCLKWLVTAVTNASLLTTGTLPIARIADGTVTPAKLAAIATMNGNWIEERLTATLYRWTQTVTSTQAISTAVGSLFCSGFVSLPTKPTGVTPQSVTATCFNNVASPETMAWMVVGTNSLARLFSYQSVASTTWTVTFVIIGTKS